MILPDVSVLMHAHNPDSRVHGKARAWWDGVLAGTEGVGLAWVTILGFIRIATHRGITHHPMPVAAACERIEEWLSLPHFHIPLPAEGHFSRLHKVLKDLGTAGNLTTDAHLAALAREYRAEIHSADVDFARFPGIRWRNPLRGK